MRIGHRRSALVRRAPDLFIAAFLALQVALPLSYYLGSGDAHDERFAWRMFSTRRLASCEVEVADERADGARTRVDLGKELQEAWIAWLRRGDPTVIEALARHRCQAGIVAMNYRRSCQTGAGAQLPAEERRIPCSP